MVQQSKVSRSARLAGVVVMATSTVLALAVLGIILWEDPHPDWEPRAGSLFGIDILYDPSAPTLGLIVLSAVIACLAAAAVVIHEARVAARHRRTAPEVLKRPLAPRRIMEATRGEFAGEVTITALIPAHNEAQNLGATLESLRQQTAAPDRIIVVADNCTDETVPIARAAGVEVFETKDNVHKKGGGLNQALAGILPTLGANDTLLIMDADTRFADTRFLATARQRFTSDRALMAVGGLFRGEPGNGLLGQFQRNEFARYSREIKRRRGRVFVLTGTASVFRATALREVAASRGGLLPGHHGEVYDTVALTEDNEITLAIKTLGGLTTSPNECGVVTEIMPTWRALWKQRLRWQRGALENLGQYGLTSTTARYWSQQIGISYSVIALTAYFVLIIIMMLALTEWIWFTFWITVGIIFMLERVITVWSGGWKARLLAVFVIPELLYDLYCNIIFVKGVLDMTFAKEATWSHHEQGPRRNRVAGGQA